MFPQSPELTAKLHSMRHAEIRAEFARYHLIQQATQGVSDALGPGIVSVDSGGEVTPFATIPLVLQRRIKQQEADQVDHAACGGDACCVTVWRVRCALGS